MKEKQTQNKDLILKTLTEKSSMKQRVFDNTLITFRNLKEVLEETSTFYNTHLEKADKRITLAYKDRGIFQCEMKVAGDLLIFHMHSNIFEFDRDHGIWKTSYVQKDKNVSYCGIINIYNFLADSFRYNRTEDLGYLIARIFINKDFHYFVEGKRQMGYLYNSFGQATIDKKSLKDIVESAMIYTLEFDLLVPPYDTVKLLSVEQINEKRRNSPIQTGKRLGFSFNSDDIMGDNLDYTGA